jgi:hypothetical protein
MKHHEDHILELCGNLVEKGVGSSIKAIHLMRVSGKLASGWNVIRRETAFYTAHTARVAHSVRRKHHFVKLTMGVIRELNFWLTNLSQLNGKPLWTIEKPTAFDTRIRVDAGEPGWGGHAEVVCGRVPEQQPEANVAWEKNEKIRSSTWREFMGLFGILQAFVGFIAGTSVLVCVDARNVFLGWRRGRSRVSDNHDILVNFF